jgi:transcription elongation factor GreA
MDKKFELSPEKLQQLKQELKQLIEVEKPQIINDLTVARDAGDLSENADYDAAKNKQSEIENRIAEIELILNNYVLIKKSGDAKTVSLGSTVHCTIDKNNKKIAKKYVIVGEVDADPFQNKISNVSPIALAIIGKSVGQTVKLTCVEKPYNITIDKIE